MVKEAAIRVRRIIALPLTLTTHLLILAQAIVVSEAVTQVVAELLVTGDSLSVSLISWSQDTLENLKVIPGVTAVIEVFPNHKEESLKCMLLVYVNSEPEKLVQEIAHMQNIKYAQVTPKRYLID